MTIKTFSSARKTTLGAIGAMLVCLIAGCGKEAPKSAGGDAAAPAQAIPLNIGTLKIAALSNLYAAEKLGYFKQQGLAVTFTMMNGGSELLPAVSAGKIDITLSIPSSAIQAIDKGFDFKMVMQNEIAAKDGQDSQAVFVNADSTIDNVQQLKGKTVAINTIKNQMWVSFSHVLETNGLKENAVNYVELPFPNMEDMLLNKQVDAVFNVEPFTSKMLGNSKFKVISYPATAALPGQPLGAFWASGKWLASNGDTAQKFVNAMNQANAYIAAHPDEVPKFISEYTGIKLETTQQMHPVNWNSKVDKNTIQGLLDLMKHYALTKKELKVDDIVFPTALN